MEGGVAGGRAAGLTHVVGLQQLLDGQTVAAPVIVHEQAVRHQPELGVRLRRCWDFILDMNHGDGHVLGRRLVVADGRCAAVVLAAVHALHSLVISRQSSDDRVAGQRVGVILARVLLVSPSLNCITKVPETHKTAILYYRITVLDIIMVKERGWR